MEFLSGAIVSEIRTRTLASPVPTIVGIVWANYGNLIIINTSPGMNRHIKKITLKNTFQFATAFGEKHPACGFPI